MILAAVWPVIIGELLPTDGPEVRLRRLGMVARHLAAERSRGAVVDLRLRLSLQDPPHRIRFSDRAISTSPHAAPPRVQLPAPCLLCPFPRPLSARRGLPRDHPDPAAAVGDRGRLSFHRTNRTSLSLLAPNHPGVFASPGPD